MNTIHNRFGKMLVVCTLSLAIAFSGSMLMTPKSAHAATIADNVISTGMQFQGVPYKFGARTGRTDVFDCSSFTQYVYRLNGVSIPRSSRQQSNAGTYVPRNQLQPGDLVFFYSPIHHVAIYMGNGKLLHTFGKAGVTVTSLNSGWWSSHYNTARRVLPGNGQVIANPIPQPVGRSGNPKPQRPSVPVRYYDDGNQQGEY